MDKNETVCAECGVTGDFCGYHNLGSEKKSLCVACAEAEITVWTITLADYEGGEYNLIYEEDNNGQDLVWLDLPQPVIWRGMDTRSLSTKSIASPAA